LFCLLAIITSKILDAAAYGNRPYTETQNSPFFGNYPVSNSERPRTRPLRTSDTGFKENFSWNPELFYPRRPGIHGPQTDINADRFRPQGQTQPVGGGLSRPSQQNFIGRRPQPETGVSKRPNLLLPPAADDADDIFIFDRPTSEIPRPGGNETPLTSPSTSTTTTEANCDCPWTPEFNPVCGSNGETYTNPGKLKCAIFCGTGSLLLL